MIVAGAGSVAARSGVRFVDGYVSADISAGKSSLRCSVRNANTLPAGTRSRQVSHTFGPTISPMAT